MRAAVYNRFGPPEVLQITEIDTPVPKDDEFLVKVYATSVTAGDVRMRAFDVPLVAYIPARLFLGIRKPRKPVLGMEVAGEVVAVGKDVTRYQVGDKVYGSTLWSGIGGYAEYKVFPEKSVTAIMPNNLTYEQAATVPVGGPTALRFLRDANIQSGHDVLIYGASGSVGTYAVQLARHFGAEVTGVCSTANLELVESLGATTVIDYTQEDFTQRHERYDIVFDAVGKINKRQGKQVLKPDGVFVSVHGNGKERVRDLAFFTELIEAGELVPVIDRCYPLDDIVEAHRYVSKGHKKGNVAIEVASA